MTWLPTRSHHPQRQERCITHIVVVAVRAVLIALVIFRHVLPERLLALLAEERHLRRLCQPVRLRLGVALGAVEPLPAARCADGDLGVEDVFAERGTLSTPVYVNVAVGSSGSAISSDGWDDDDGAFHSPHSWHRSSPPHTRPLSLCWMDG